VINLHARAGGQADAGGHTVVAKRPLDATLYGCSEADPLLWAPSPPPTQPDCSQQPDLQRTGMRQPLAVPCDAGKAPRFTVAQQQQQPPPHCSAAQPVPQQPLVTLQGGPQGSGVISAHRPTASSEPITIGGRRHDWWALQLQEQRTGFVQQVTKSVCCVHIGGNE
jgi:hypothetical protein